MDQVLKRTNKLVDQRMDALRREQDQLRSAHETCLQTKINELKKEIAQLSVKQQYFRRCIGDKGHQNGSGK